MTLTAIRKETGERVCLAGRKFSREGRDWEGYYCPVTGLPVNPVGSYLRKGSPVTAHWRIKGKAVWDENVLPDIEYGRYSKDVLRLGESVEHQEGKYLLLHQANKIDPECLPSIGQLEYRIWMPNREKYRIADVAFIFPFGLVSVYEIQLSEISIDELTERTSDYFEAGVDVQWCFGDKMFKNAIVDWHKEFIGRYPCRMLFNESRSEDWVNIALMESEDFPEGSDD